MKPPFTDVTIPQSVLEVMTSKVRDLPSPPILGMDLRGLVMAEEDPNGKSPNEAGAKLDAGKTMPSLILSAMPRALMEVAKVGTAGAAKYSRNGWIAVPDGIERYTDAMDRHRLKECIEGPLDKDFLEQGVEVYHAAQIAWNALARLELMLREKEKSND